jgi:hypothetical protein
MYLLDLTEELIVRFMIFTASPLNIGDLMP